MRRASITPLVPHVSLKLIYKNKDIGAYVIQMEWFHFSDFHIGRPNGPQNLAMGSLIEAVECAVSKCDSKKIDAVFITGDIAHSGQASEYERFCNEFLLPLRKISAFEKTTVFAVPGNHDVDCDANIPIAWETIGKRNQEVFFCEDEDGIRYRSKRVDVFNSYWDFIQKNGIISPNPNKEVSFLKSDNVYPIDILTTNTAYFADRDIDSRGEMTPSPINSFRTLLGNRTGQKPLIILAHHPLTCMFKHEQKPLETFLVDKKAVLLHGHEHAPRVTFNNDGTIRTFGFGAVYLASQQSRSSAPYLNTFAHCRLDDKLYIRSFSWQSDSGKWLDTTTTQLTECLTHDTGEVYVHFPSFSSYSEDKVTMRDVQRAAPKPTKLFLIEDVHSDTINKLFPVSANLSSIYQKGEPKIREKSNNDGKMIFELESDSGQRNLLIFIWAVNHILSSKEVEAVNTELDTEGYSSATVISIGNISSDAKDMYLRLQARKPIEILTNEGLTADTSRLLTDNQRTVLLSLDAATHTTCLLLGQEDLYLLAMDESESEKQFFIVPSSGLRLSPTDPVVARLRKVDPDFAIMKYCGEASFDSSPKGSDFSENSYLEHCHKEYNVMKYAALANVGIRFSDLPLEKLYVNASASEVSDNNSMRPEQLIDDHLASYPISEELKEYIQSQLLSSVRQGERQETSQARDFCQKYSAVLITGDPGSGKTCFVKNEILAYCKKAISSSSSNEEQTINWHSNHIPVMVSLSEVVAEKDLDDKGILAIASRILERRGLIFPPEDINRQTLYGRIAFFFDGLDEVVSIEKRAQVVKHINNLVTEHINKGNRFVVTSRPAALQVVDLLPTLHKLELQGLTEIEIQTLAGRLLQLEIAGTQNGVHVGEGNLNDKDNIVITQLLNDCRRNPGISRMAQNPLLLTLLIMIYANAGAPSAKKHRIYEEAIKTLASVRGREAGHQPISAQDLRERLGAIALSVYKKESGLLPLRSEVSDIVRQVMIRQRGEDVSADDSNTFIQRVAESTGLIALEARHGEADGQAIVTFMHHSFLEYFAAIGLNREIETIDIEALVREPRWREILTLLAGIIGENADVSPIIKRFLPSKSDHDVDAKLLLFAMDCALECEIPSESAQRLISNGIKDCLIDGSGRLDVWVRAEIGQRLDYLIKVCGGSEFDGMLVDLMSKDDEAVSAAAIDLVGHVCASGYESAGILNAFKKACLRSNDVIWCAVCAAASKASVFRVKEAMKVIANCLKKSRRNQQAAYEALANVPSLAAKYWGDIINGLDDNNQRTSRLASIAAMHAGLNVDVISLNSTRKDILLRALDNVAIVSSSNEYRNLKMKKDTLNRLLTSQNIRDRILGIRLLPLADGEERYVYQMLIDLVRGKTPREELVAGLTALCWSGSVLALVTLDDLKIVIDHLKNGTADVRVAAVQLLGCFGKALITVEALLSENFSKLEIDDYCERISALSKAKVGTDRIRELFFQELNDYISDKKKMSPENLRRARTLLDAAKRLGETAPPTLVEKIRGLVDNFKVDDELKRKAILCFPAIAMPSEKTVKSVIKLCQNPLPDMEVDIVQVPSILAKKCRSNVDYVVASVGSLFELLKNLLSLHAKYSKRQPTDENEYLVTELRNGITDINQIIVAFKDFIDKGSQAAESKKTN
jgi:predicted phosphodiesterase